MERTTNRGRPKGSRGGRGKGKRGRKPRVVVSDTEESNEIETNAPDVEEKNAEPETDNMTDTPAPEVVEDTPMEVKETEMSPLEPLETPSFTTMTRNVPQVMLRLNWDHKVNLIGEKVLNPMIYCCDQCTKPILIYGRMIQCKHVFCLTCARTEAVLKICPRCNEKVVRVEQTGLGTVFMCTHGGTRYGKTGCRRTYLSQRDLQAHINHRHVMIPAPLPLELKTTEKPSLLAATATISGQQQQPPLNSHLRKDSMVQPLPVIKQPFNSFQAAPPSTANKMSHHSQDMHGFYNNQHGSGHQFGNNGAGSSSGNNFYQPFNSNMGHYSQQGPPQQQQQQNWNQQQQQQYFR